jgi:hypothetical protein
MLVHVMTCYVMFRLCLVIPGQFSLDQLRSVKSDQVKPSSG